MAEADRLRDKILEDARLQAKEMLKRAESEAAAILNAAKAEAEAKKRAAAEEAGKEAEERKKRLLASADLEGRKQILKAKQDMVDEAFARALDKLSSLPADRYVDLIASMAVEAVRSGTEEIILSPKDRDAYGIEIVNKVNSKLSEKGMKGAVSLSDTTRNIKCGFILKSGNIEINNSFEVIIKMRRDELEAEVVKVLFG